MTVGHLEVAQGELLEFCRRNGVRKLALFGSVLTDRFSDASDVDALVEFKPGERVGYLRMSGLERELSNIFGGRRVDLRTPRSSASTSAMKCSGPPSFNMPPTDGTRLLHMLDAAREAVKYGAGCTASRLSQDRVLALALVKCIEITRRPTPSRACFPPPPAAAISRKAPLRNAPPNDRRASSAQ